MAGTPLEKQKEDEKAGEKRRKRGEKMESFFCSVFEFLTNAGFDITNFLLTTFLLIRMSLLTPLFLAFILLMLWLLLLFLLLPRSEELCHD